VQHGVDFYQVLQFFELFKYEKMLEGNNKEIKSLQQEVQKDLYVLYL